MPSGPKRRKAAKKKKEAAHHHHHNHHHEHHHHHHPHSADVHPHGDDDLKHHDDDKESDAEEVSSPASQDHPNDRHQFTDGEREEVEKIEDGLHVHASSEENKSFGGLKETNEATKPAVVEEWDIEIEQELKPADVELNNKNTLVEDFVPQEEAHDGILLHSLDKVSVVQIESNSKLTSDEVSGKSEIVENVEPRKEDSNGVLLQSLDEGSVVQIETESKPDRNELNSKTAIVESVEPQKEGTNEILLQSILERSVVQIDTDSKPANNELKSKNAIMENVEPQKEANDRAELQSPDQGSVGQIEADLKTMDEPESKKVPVVYAETPKESTDRDLSQSHIEESHVIDKAIVVVDNAQVINSTVSVNSLYEGVTQVANNIEAADKHSSSVKSRSVDEMEDVKLSDEKTNGNTSVSADSNGQMKENGEKEVILQERNGRMSPACVDLGPDKGVDEAIIKTDDNVAASDAKISASREIGEKLTVSYDVPATETANGADSSRSTHYVEHLKDPKVPKSSDSQPLVASAPRVGQRTSWMGCCGLLEVFSGSNR